MMPRLTRTLALTTTAALALAACGSGDDDPAAVPTSPEITATGEGEDATHTDAATEPADGGSADPQAAAGEVDGVPVYYVVESPDGPRLVREYRTVPDRGDLVTSALMAMMSLLPNDPDYSTPWVAPESVTVERQGDLLRVDVPAVAFSQGIGSELSARAIDQLVYTATAAAAVEGDPVEQVEIVKDGQQGEVWGHLTVGEALTRSPQIDVLNHTWILSPTEGESVPAGEVTIRGYGASFEGNFVVHVDGPGVDVMEPTTGTGIGFGEWEYSLELEPGEYTVHVENSSGQDDFQPHTDSKTFTVE